MTDLIQEYRAHSERQLDLALNISGQPERLYKAMRYSTLAGGKRFRALLVYGAGLAVQASREQLDVVAAALECVHAYSLIHDDLPAMDDDDLRRGQPTNHIKFDEATAILAGDALLTFAFELIADSSLSDRQVRQITAKLAAGAGHSGMVGGQMLDILATEQKIDRAQLEEIHRRKTGALIEAAVICGALCNEQTTEEQLTALTCYADKIGLAFQVIDDVLDIESTTEELGKPHGSDLTLGKATYPSLIGLQESKKLAQKLYRDAIESIEPIGDNTPLPASTDLLKDLAELVVKRTK